MLEFWKLKKNENTDNLSHIDLEITPSNVSESSTDSRDQRTKCCGQTHIATVFTFSETCLVAYRGSKNV